MNWSFEQFHLFPQFFPKGLFFNVLKRVYMEERVNSLTNNKILGVSKLKAFVDNKINVAQMMIPVFDRIENIVGKGGGHQKVRILW